MSIRPPSLQKTYDEFWSGDAAFVQPPENASADEIAAHADRVRVARETDGWGALLVEGGTPTKFVLRPLPGHVFRTVMDALASGAIGPAIVPSVLFRAALRSVENLEGFKVGFVNEFGLKSIADNTVPDALDAFDISIVAELGSEVGRRARTIAPKS